MLPRGLSALDPKIQILLKNVFMYHLIGDILTVQKILIIKSFKSKNYCTNIFYSFTIFIKNKGINNMCSGELNNMRRGEFSTVIARLMSKCL